MEGRKATTEPRVLALTSFQERPRIQGRAWAPGGSRPCPKKERRKERKKEDRKRRGAPRARGKNKEKWRGLAGGQLSQTPTSSVSRREVAGYARAERGMRCGLANAGDTGTRTWFVSILCRRRGSASEAREAGSGGGRKEGRKGPNQGKPARTAVWVLSVSCGRGTLTCPKEFLGPAARHGS